MSDINTAAPQKTNILITIINAVAVISMALVVVALIVSVYLKSNLDDIPKYGELVVSDEYMDVMMKDIYSSMEAECLYLSVPVDEMYKEVNKTTVYNMCNYNVQCAIKTIFLNMKFEYKEYPADDFYPAVDSFMQKYSEEHNLVVERALRSEIVSSLSSVVTTRINFANAALISKIPSLNREYNMLRMLKDYIGVFLLLFAIVFAAFFIVNRKTLSKGLFLIASSVWAGVMIIAIPIWYISSNDITSKIRIAQSPIRITLVNIIDYLVGNLRNLTILLAVASTVILVLSVAVKLWRDSANGKTEDTFY